MCYAPDKEEFLKEAFRVLKPGGRLVLLDGFRTGRPFSTTEDSLFREWLRGWTIPNLAIASEFLALAQSIGFSDCLFRDISKQMLPSMRRLRRLAITFYPLESILRVFRVRSSIQHQNIKSARLQWEAIKLGLWIYGVVYALKTS